MPGLARKLIICAAVDGLMLHPVGLKSSGISIEYGTNNITNLGSSENVDPDHGLEAHGIVGLLNLISSSYLISITRHEQVAHIHGKPIFTIKDVTLVPLSSRVEAEKAIINARKTLHASNAAAYSSDTEDEADSAQDVEEASKNDVEADATALESPAPNTITKGTSFVRDVIHNKGKYGRFAAGWFNRSSANPQTGAETIPESGTDVKKSQSVADKPEAPEREDHNLSRRLSEDRQTLEHQGAGDKQKSSPKPPKAIEVLTPRILKNTRLFFSSSGFFYSYDWDISESLCQQSDDLSHIPLWKRFGGLFFWNKHLLQPFIASEQNPFILPIMQGFVGQREFQLKRAPNSNQSIVEEAGAHQHETSHTSQSPLQTAEPDASETSFLLTLVSRRSVKRAGLRYLRRGVDEKGNVANFVETEQILSPASSTPNSKVFSLLQVRGSIPLYFSQSPYSFKPIPVLFGSQTSNQTAFKQHFSFLLSRYGNVQSASLVDKHGTELQIGEAYEQQANSLIQSGGVDGKSIAFEWFDFHGVCKGMKFENVSVLLDTLQKPLDTFSWSVKKDGRNVKQQQGVLRTNCMDCLDRTNVVQSAVAGRALQQQLADLDFDIDLQNDPGTRWFNVLWADNGDAISKQYAGTSALKGDFTRTRKRNWTGALSDFSLTLNRYYNNIFGDYFLQTCMDYYLGNAGPTVFDEFETNMKSQDYALDMQSIRQAAIDTSIKIVLEDPNEDVVAGWTLSCPHHANSLRSLPFEECVVLLTTVALYFCRFDWNTEKVSSFERIRLSDITALWRGAYITNALGVTNVDETHNVGFALRYSSAGPATIRTNTRTLENEEGQDHENPGGQSRGKNTDAGVVLSKGESRMLAFKATPSRIALTSGITATSPKISDERKLIDDISDKIHAATLAVVAREQDSTQSGSADQTSFQIEEKDIISVADARKNTGYVETLGYSLKKLVWS